MIRHQPRFLAIAIALAACGNAEVDHGANEAAVRSTFTEYVAAGESGDVERFLSFFADDAVIMPPGQAIIHGREALAAFARPFFSQFTIRQVFSLDLVRVADDWAVATYTYVETLTPTAGGPAVEERGKGISVLRRGADGAWRFTHAIWNQTAAAAEQR